MKERFAAFLVAGSRIILAIFIFIALGCAALIPQVNVNRDMTQYLPRDSAMRQGLDLMEAEFGKEDSSTLKIMFEDLRTPDEKKSVLAELKALPHVDSVDYETDSTDYNRDTHTLYVINSDCEQYSEEAKQLWLDVKDTYGQDHEICLGGTIHDSNELGLPLWIALTAVGLIFLIILVMANSWAEPLAFMVTVAIAVLINMGTYVFFPSISRTTFGIVAILQLALSMDYSIMLLNRYRQQRSLTDDKRQAMREALSLSFGAITGSSLTTFAGLLALLFMSFTIGADIGLALAKGVLISLLSIFTVMPAMLLAIDGLMARTVKRTIPNDLPRLSGLQYKLRLPLALLFAGLFLTGFIIRGGVDFSYAQYGSGDKIDEVFGRDNTMVMMYNEKDSAEAAKLAENLDGRDIINSAVCYETTIGKKRTAQDMKDFIDDMRDEEDAGVTDREFTTSMVKLIYYDYFKGDPDFTLTIPAFVSYLQDDVLDDEDFGSTIDDQTRKDINDLSKFTDAHTLTTSRSAGGLADFFDMKKKDAEQLLLYYQIEKSKKDAGKMTLPGFVDFILDDLASDPDYGSMIGSGEKKQLRSLRVFTDGEKMQKKYPYAKAASILGMDEAQVRMIYVARHAKGDGTMTIAELSSVLGLMAEDPVLADRFGGDETAQLIAGLAQIGQMDPAPYPVPDMVQALTSYGIPLDAEALTLAYSYRDVTEAPDEYRWTVRSTIKYLLTDESASASLSKIEKTQLERLLKIIDTSISGKKLSASDMSKILGMDKKDARSIYLLHTYKHGSTSSWKLSPQQFINFLVGTVLKDKSMRSRIGGSADDLKLAQKLINSVVAGKSFTASGLAGFFAGYSDEMDEDSIRMLYELYGSENYYDESWTMDLMALVKHLDEEMIPRESFASSMDEKDKQDVREMRGDLDEAAELLKGEHYGRMMISADLEEDSDETRAFMDELTAYRDQHFGEASYMIGSTPMAYEMSQTFHSELNRITILTALFILFIVLLTFRRILTSVILVLLIQCAVFLTMSVLNLLHVDMNYLALLIVQSIMMGATIDYAIIYSTYYVEQRALLPVREAIRASYKGSLQTILTSATILIAAVGVLSFAFSEPATRQICRILSVGCLIATVLVIFVLPGVLALFDRFVARERKEEPPASEVDGN